jgi:hypothetical protein
MAPLTDADFKLLLLLVDGELAEQSARRAQAEALVAQHPEAREFVQGWTNAKGALRQAVLAPEADLSRLRGRVMAKLPAEPRPTVAPEPRNWLERLGLGKVSLAVGLAAAAAVALVVSIGAPHKQPSTVGAVAEDLPNCEEPCPEVIIEDTEVDDGGMMVRHGEHTGDATIIWHGAATNETGEG